MSGDGFEVVTTFVVNLQKREKCKELLLCVSQKKLGLLICPQSLSLGYLVLVWYLTDVGFCRLYPEFLLVSQVACWKG